MNESYRAQPLVVKCRFHIIKDRLDLFSFGGTVIRLESMARIHVTDRFPLAVMAFPADELNEQMKLWTMHADQELEC